VVKLSENTLKQLTGIYLYANTPSYLYEKMRALPEIEEIGRAGRTAEAEATIRSLLDHVEEPNDLLTLYGLIVSLSFRSSQEVQRLLQELSRSDLDWVGRLAKHIDDSLIPSTILDLRGRTPRPSSPLTATSGSTADISRWEPSPRIAAKEL